jgi:hypothetical protein
MHEGVGIDHRNDAVDRIDLSHDGSPVVRASDDGEPWRRGQREQP